MSIAAREAEAAANLAAREAAVGRIEGLREQAERILPGLQVELTAREAELAKHDAERQGILGKLAAARAALIGERQRIERETSKAEAVLLANYDPRIDGAIGWFRARREALLRKKPDTDISAEGVNVFTLTRGVVHRSNAGAISRALSYCLSSIRNLETMRLVPALDVARIEELKRGIPDISQMEEITGEKPLPRVNTDPPLPAEDETTWRLGNINEKFRRWREGGLKK